MNRLFTHCYRVLAISHITGQYSLRKNPQQTRFFRCSFTLRLLRRKLLASMKHCQVKHLLWWHQKDRVPISNKGCKMEIKIEIKKLRSLYHALASNRTNPFLVALVKNQYVRLGHLSCTKWAIRFMTLKKEQPIRISNISSCIPIFQLSHLNRHKTRFLGKFQQNG